LSDVLAEVGVEVRQVIASGGYTQSDFYLQVVSDTHPEPLQKIGRCHMV